MQPFIEIFEKHVDFVKIFPLETFRIVVNMQNILFLKLTSL